MTDLRIEALPGSAETWRDEPPAVRVPDALRVDRTLSTSERLAAWKRRHALRGEHAQAVFHASRHPERGLPVARARKAFAFVGSLLSTRKASATLMILFNVLAAAAALVIPRLLGDLVDDAASGASLGTTDSVLLGVLAFVLAQAGFTFVAKRASAVLGYDLLAAARESVVNTVLKLPLGRVEAASSGDLVTRITSDVGKMSNSVRWALPHMVTSATMVVLTVVALLFNSPLLTLPVVATLVILFFAVRAYLKRAAAGYITESATYSRINSTVTETVEGARTIEALGLQELRQSRLDDDIAESAQAERYTMSLRNLLFIWLDFAFQLPIVLVILLGTWGFDQGWVTVGQVTTAAIYLQQLVSPLDRLIQVLDTLQVGIAATTRLLGVAEVPEDRTPGGVLPAASNVEGRDLRFAYRKDHDVLHGVDLVLEPGERLAIVGPSGSGKSTLGRLVAGINRPRTGQVEVGGVDVMDLPLDVLRTEVCLVTQEHHVFVGTVRDNVVLAREGTATDETVWRALEAVDAREWVERLPGRLDTLLGHGRASLTPAQAQQIALARLMVADPHTLVLDEATSLIDPRTARHLEGSMGALLADRTVVAIAHRLHTAHDADRIAVVINGRIAELGSHDDLLAADGEYAHLWRTWSS
ncbi:ABC transporter ATP-binding protein [Tessaracoccus caeni]|uniref:ABC transporter ATP-binding protein n=1 Tax=Tessaracoccus caeni TaxID=3031239 RepID=UPI0023DA6753|nr:ABC transporter ATP-binding protein [Tessaracoccus caeni]MDF1488645.1 ABC transporter ATP-binding protein [Tessaracoccus caeni]